MRHESAGVRGLERSRRERHPGISAVQVIDTMYLTGTTRAQTQSRMRPSGRRSGPRRENYGDVATIPTDGQTGPDATVTSSELPDPNQPDETGTAHRTLTVKMRLRPVTPAERSGQVSKCREAAPLRSGPDSPAALTSSSPCLQPGRGAVRIPDNGTTWARSHACSLPTRSGLWVRARPENTDP